MSRRPVTPKNSWADAAPTLPSDLTSCMTLDLPSQPAQGSLADLPLPLLGACPTTPTSTSGLPLNLFHLHGARACIGNGHRLCSVIRF